MEITWGFSFRKVHKLLHSYWPGTVQNCSSCSIPSVENKLLHSIRLLLRCSEKDFLCNKHSQLLKSVYALCIYSIERWHVSCSTSEMSIGTRGLSQQCEQVLSCSWNWISCSCKTSLQVYSRVFERFLHFHGDFLPPEPAVVAKSSILLDVKPWDDETDMAKLEECVRSIQADGLVWGSCEYGEIPEQGEGWWECRPLG